MMGWSVGRSLDTFFLGRERSIRFDLGSGSTWVRVRSFGFGFDGWVLRGFLSRERSIRFDLGSFGFVRVRSFACAPARVASSGCTIRSTPERDSPANGDGWVLRAGARGDAKTRWGDVGDVRGRASDFKRRAERIRRVDEWDFCAERGFGVRIDGAGVRTTRDRAGSRGVE